MNTYTHNVRFQKRYNIFKNNIDLIDELLNMSPDTEIVSYVATNSSFTFKCTHKGDKVKVKTSTLGTKVLIET